MLHQLPFVKNAPIALALYAWIVWLAFSGCSAGASPRDPAAALRPVPSRLAVAGIQRPQVPVPSAVEEEVALSMEGDKLNAKYNVAIFDAAVFRADRQDAELDPVDRSSLEVTSFISCYRCESCRGCPQRNCEACQTCSPLCLEGEQSLPSPAEIWVTPIPQLEEFCAAIPKDQLVLRLQQYLGLPPIPGQPFESWRFLDFTLDQPEALFRPCTDPDPTTSGPCTESFPAGASLAHRSWIADQALSSWQLPDGYPWTRLGYTYNWNPDSESVIGGSEYVVPEGAPVTVRGLDPLTRYCAKSE